MSKGYMNPDVQQESEFDVDLGTGRIAHCWEACSQPYQDCEFSAGLVNGITPDDFYLRLRKNGEGEPLTIFLRKDEALAVLYVLAGALWSGEILEWESAEGGS